MNTEQIEVFEALIETTETLAKCEQVLESMEEQDKRIDKIFEGVGEQDGDKADKTNLKQLQGI